LRALAEHLRWWPWQNGSGKPERALILRINRRLKASGRMLHVARGARAEQQLGHFFIVDDPSSRTTSI
jgi:hypothetical protein